jgi:hypothetical protein
LKLTVKETKISSFHVSKELENLMYVFVVAV